MKKLLLLAAFGLMAAPAFAQNSATTTQNGNNNDSDVTQTADVSGGATANVIQGQAASPADNNEALVSQKGANAALIEQLGDRNDGQVMQGIRPDGTAPGTAIGNYAQIQQLGDNNSGLIDGADDDGSVIAQGVNGTATGSDAIVTQRGSNGRVQVYQGNNGGLANGVRGEVDQDGNNNMASIRQGVMGGTAQGPGDATDSQASITQEASTSGSEAFIRQGADDPSSLSTAPNFAASDFDDANITQRGGNGNSASIDQGTDGRTSQGSNADVTQDGANNITEIGQAGRIQRAGAEMTGNRNEVYITQGYNDATSINNDARLDIVGDRNDVFVDQDGDANQVLFRMNAIVGDGNLLDADQVGESNTLKGEINGDRNDVYVNQSGTQNAVLGGTDPTANPFTGNGGGPVDDGLTINGNNNDVFVDQTGDFGLAFISVTDNGNFVDIDQTRAAVDAMSGDVATAIVDGVNNSAVIVQN